MTWYPSSELLLDPSPPRVADSLPGQLAKGVARGAAAARRSDPRPFMSRPRGGGGGFALSLAIEAWNVFTAEPVPAPISAIALPELPAGTSYTITGTGTYRSQNPVDPQEFTGQIGPSIVFAGVGNVRIATREAGNAIYVDEGIGTPLATTSRISDAYNLTLFRWVRIDSFVMTPREGDPTPVPGLLPFPGSPEDGDYPEDVPIPVMIPQLPGVSPIPIFIPVILPRPSDLGTRPVPILYPPGLTPDQRRALPQMWLTPEGVQVGRGSSEDRIISTPGDSIAIDLDVDLDSDYQRREPPVVVTCTGDPEPPSDCCDCEEIRVIVAEELDSKFPPVRPNQVIDENYSAADSNSIVLPPFSKSVRVSIVDPPANIKEQEGNDGAPNIFYNGWYSFGVGTFGGDRKPIQYNDQSMPVPSGATTFTYTIIGGGTASVTVKYTIEI